MGPKALLAVLLVLCAALGPAACGPDERSPSSGGEERASTPAPTTREQEQPTTRERPTTQEQTREEQTRPEETRSELEELLEEPAYTTVGDGIGALSLRVPAAWGEVIVGQESEGEGSWTTFGGVAVASSITAAPDLAAWHETVGAEGTYAVASRALAQRYTDEELVAFGPNDFSVACERGARSGFSRPPYSGVAQAWKGCGGDPAASYVTLSAAPEGRECVVVMQIGLVENDEGLEDGQHLLETFEADCSLVPAEAEVEAGAEDEAPASSAEAYAYERPQPAEVPQYGAGVACSDFVTMYGEPSQWQAQQFYDGVATPEQRAALDPDGDGFACSEGNSASAPETPAGPDNPAYPGAEGCVNPGPCGVNPVEDPGDNVDPKTGLVVGDDTPDCATPEQVLASGLCKNVIVGAGS